MAISKIPGAGLETTGTASVNTFLRGDNAWAGTITSGTAVASTSGTSIDFTGIPATAKRITVMFSGVSTNGTSNIQVQLGAGTLTTSGYVGSANYSTSVVQNSAGLIVQANVLAANLHYGQLILANITGNTWVSSGTLFPNSTNSGTTSAGGISLSGTLDRIRITTVNGTDTFDAGTINIMWES